MLKVDLHLHSKYSWDSKVEPIEYIQKAEAMGFGAISITDHNSTESHSELDNLQKKTDVILIPGQEVSTADGHLLVYGWVDSLPSNIPMLETVSLAKKKGALLTIAAHPYDILRGGKGNKVLSTGIDGVETLNASMLFGYFNWKSERSVPSSFIKVGNSDAHRSNEFGMAYTEIADVMSVGDVLEALREGIVGGRRLGVVKKSIRFFRRKLGFMGS